MSDNGKSMPSKKKGRMMHQNMRRAHDHLWDRFYRPETQLFYEYDLETDEFPTAEEIAQPIPNSAGWVTGMEDCCLNGGWILDGLLCAHRVTGNDEWAEKARQVFQGLVKLGQIPQCKGFVARGFVPGRTDVYPNSSADQYTSFVYAMWAYATSPIATEKEKREATAAVLDACRLIESFNHDIPTIKMKPSIYGDTPTIEPGRACRLLLFYKAAHVLSGEAHWHGLYLEKVEEEGRARLASIYGPEPWPEDRNLHAHYQSQAAWSALLQMETDPAIRETYEMALRSCARAVLSRIDGWQGWAAGPHDSDPHWRALWNEWRLPNPDVDVTEVSGRNLFLKYKRDRSVSFHNDHKQLRNPLDALAICMYCPDAEIRKNAAARGWPALASVDFGLVKFSTALACLEGAYWRGVEAGLFPMT